MTYAVLLVDDESVDLEWLRQRVVRSSGKLRVAAAVHSAFEALQIMREQPIDILISDIRMPIMSGLDLAEQARELLPQLPIVFTSGHEDFDYAKRAIRIAAADYLLKPVDDGELLGTIERVVGHLEGRRPIGGPLRGPERTGSAPPGEPAAGQPASRKLIEEIRSYTASRLASKITLKRVADHFGFSPNYLGQLFKEETGELYSDYLIRARVERACELLLEPTLKIYEVADRVGYRNILYFNRQFKQMTGQTPGDYRRTLRV